LACGLALVPGCTWQEWVNNVTWKNDFRTQFAPLNPEDENIAQVDVATIRWNRGNPQLERELWSELDEQVLNLELRRQMARHGLRFGLMRAAMGSRLQATITDPTNIADLRKNQPSEAGMPLFAAIDDKLVQVKRGRPACTVEARRVVARSEHDLFWPTGPRAGATKLLVTDADHGDTVRQVDQVELGFSVRLQKLPDSQTRVRLVPVAKYSQVDWGDAFLDALRTKSTLLKTEMRYEPLAVEVVLGHDQYLVVTAQRSDTPDADVWGDLAFVDHEADQQTVLVIRGASVPGTRAPDPPRKGQAWPLAWQTTELTPSDKVEK